MDIALIERLVASIGFPILMCLLMYKHSIDSAKLHKEEVDRLSECIENNTFAVERLADKVGGKE